MNVYSRGRERWVLQLDEFITLHSVFFSFDKLSLTIGLYMTAIYVVVWRCVEALLSVSPRVSQMQFIVSRHSK